MNNSKMSVVGGVVVDEVDGEHAVLAFRRSASKIDGGLWEFPGGKIEVGESPDQALTRELREELNALAKVGSLINESTTIVGDRVISLSCYFVSFDRNPQSSTDHDEIRWIPLRGIQLEEWAKPDHVALNTLIAMNGIESRSGAAND